MKRTVLLAVVVLAILPAAAPGAFPGRNGPIVYGWFDASEGGDVAEWYSERSIRTRKGIVLGCVEQGLESMPAPAGCGVPSFDSPAVSPDGSLIAFDAGAAIALVGMDGTGFRTLPTPANDSQPAFSPSGRRLAFVRRTSATAPFWIWIRDLSTGDVRRLAAGTSPAWSTRGWIAFLRDGRIYRIRPDGTGLRGLTDARATSISWAPDGERIAFTRLAGGAFVMRTDGTGLRRIVRGQYWELAWSPNGRRIALREFHLVVVGLGGRELRDLGEVEYSGAYSVWGMNGMDWAPLP
jgi:Tol biopolymer transport system component